MTQAETQLAWTGGRGTTPLGRRIGSTPITARACELSVGREGLATWASAERAVDGDVVQGVLEYGELLVVELRDE
jgi:hypothetical protein